MMRVSSRSYLNNLDKANTFMVFPDERAKRRRELYNIVDSA